VQITYVHHQSDGEQAKDTEAEPEFTTLRGEDPRAIDLASRLRSKQQIEPDAVFFGSKLPPSRSSFIPAFTIGGLATPARTFHLPFSLHLHPLRHAN
jgi:hypothetical protein